MKKIMSLLLTVLMVFAFATPVSAVNTETTPNINSHTITIENYADGYVYEAYQVFRGDLNNEKLTNITWGTGVDGAGLLAALKADTTIGAKFTDCVTAVDVAAVLNSLSATELEKFADLVATKLTTVKSTSGTPTVQKVDGKDVYSYPITVSGDGYYFVKDQADSVIGHEAYTKYILKVIKDLTVKSKSVLPTVDKQVWDEATDDDKETDDNWGETADHEINEIFEFKLIANLPAEPDYDHYDSYKVVFVDTMSKEITFDAMVSVKINDTVIENYQKSDITVNQETGAQTFTITIANAKAYGVDLKEGATIEVIYKAHLNENAVIGNIDENLNEVYLKYSNNPNAGGEEEFGETPKDTVWVFTYKVDGTKVDGATKTPLENAEFVFYKEVDRVKNYVVLNANHKVLSWTTDKTKATPIKSVANGKFEIIGLDHGTYFLEETVAPAGYNLLKEPITVVLTATHQEIDENNAETYVLKMVDEKETKVDPSIELTVENNSGATLPETGGIGTTLFYTIGGLLFAAAAVLLISKKRMNEE